jgi:hypothetical protein
MEKPVNVSEGCTDYAAYAQMLKILNVKQFLVVCCQALLIGGISLKLIILY